MLDPAIVTKKKKREKKGLWRRPRQADSCNAMHVPHMHGLDHTCWTWTYRTCWTWKGLYCTYRTYHTCWTWKACTARTARSAHAWPGPHMLDMERPVPQKLCNWPGPTTPHSAIPPPLHYLHHSTFRYTATTPPPPPLPHPDTPPPLHIPLYRHPFPRSHLTVSPIPLPGCPTLPGVPIGWPIHCTCVLHFTPTESTYCTATLPLGHVSAELIPGAPAEVLPPAPQPQSPCAVGGPSPGSPQRAGSWSERPQRCEMEEREQRGPRS